MKLLLFIFGILPRIGVAIFCVQCTDETENGAFNKTGCISSPPSPEECHIDMTSCLIITTYEPSREENEIPSSIVRTCSSKDLGFDCRRSHAGNSAPSVEVCHETCFYDGCNNSMTNKCNDFSIFVVITFLLTLIKY